MLVGLIFLSTCSSGWPDLLDDLASRIARGLPDGVVSWMAWYAMCSGLLHDPDF